MIRGLKNIVPPTELSPSDWMLVKIARLERENAQMETRLAALRCRLTELLEKPPAIIVMRGPEDVD